jgi:hypothetical protein
MVRSIDIGVERPAAVAEVQEPAALAQRLAADEPLRVAAETEVLRPARNRLT